MFLVVFFLCAPPFVCGLVNRDDTFQYFKLVTFRKGWQIPPLVLDTILPVIVIKNLLEDMRFCQLYKIPKLDLVIERLNDRYLLKAD